MLSTALDRVGKQTLNTLEALGSIVILAGNTARTILQGRIHARNTFQQMAFIGVESLPIALLTGLSVGMVFTLQIANEFIRFGATTVIGGVSAIALVRELGPTLTGVVVAGRVGAAIAAELGSMKVTEQIDALLAMAADPIRYLVAPRVIACILMLPLLAFLADFVGIAGGFGVAVGVKGISSEVFLTSLQQLLKPDDILKGMLKAMIFGAVVGIIGCYQGMNTSNGAQGVGKATTDAVVYSLITIFVTNYFLSSWLFPGSGQ